MTVKPYKRFPRPIQVPDGRWYVSDFYSAAFLHALGHQVVGVEPTGQGGRASIIFASADSFRSDYERFIQNDVIGIQRLVDSVRVLKSLLRTGVAPSSHDDSCCARREP